MTKWPGWSNFCRCVRNDDREGKKKRRRRARDSPRRETRSLFCMRRRKVHRRYLNIHSELNIIGKNCFFSFYLVLSNGTCRRRFFPRQRLLALTYFIIIKDQRSIFMYSDLFFIENNLFSLKAFSRKKPENYPRCYFTFCCVSVILRRDISRPLYFGRSFFADNSYQAENKANS